MAGWFGRKPKAKTGEIIEKENGQGYRENMNL